MEFFKKINELSRKVTDVATDTYKTVADKSGKLLEEAKSKIAISGKEADVEEIYQNIGKTVYDMYAKGEDVGKVFTKECKNVDKIKSEIEEMNQKVMYNKKLRVCGNCSEVISIDSVFCSNCGHKQKVIKEKKEEVKKDNVKESDTKVCPTCGLVSDKDTKFCAKCGYKF